VQVMKILDSFGAGGSFTEYYAMDLDADVLIGHDGHAERIVWPLQVYHGKVGSGLLVEMSVRKGPVTLLSIIVRSGSGILVPGWKNLLY